MQEQSMIRSHAVFFFSSTILARSISKQLLVLNKVSSRGNNIGKATKQGGKPRHYKMRSCQSRKLATIINTKSKLFKIYELELAEIDH
eukprot:scaffold1172_cov180-Ochromonas_danica.AAC.14